MWNGKVLMMDSNEDDEEKQPQQKKKLQRRGLVDLSADSEDDTNSQVLAKFDLSRQHHLHHEQQQQQQPQLATTSTTRTQPPSNYYLLSTWPADNSFNLLITDCVRVWRINACADTVQQTFKPEGMSLTNFLSLAKSALTSQDISGTHFSYDLRFNSLGDVEFTLGTMLEGYDFAVVSEFTLERVKNPEVVLREILDHQAYKLDRVQLQNHQLKESVYNLQAQRDDALVKLEEFCAWKSNLEQDMYSKMIVVLNEKKKKLRSLKAELQKKCEVDLPLSSGSEQEILPKKRRRAQSDTESNSTLSPSKLPSQPKEMAFDSSQFTEASSTLQPTPCIDFFSPPDPYENPVTIRLRTSSRKRKT